ncbi:AIPR family protein [Geodermatophilus sp. SYSU D01045]
MSGAADNDYLAELQRRILTDAERTDELQVVAFTDYMREVLNDSGDLDGGETALFHTAGAKGMSASGYSISDDGDLVDILVTDYEPSHNVRTLTKTQVTRLFAAAHRFATQVDELTEMLEEAFPAWSMCAALAAALPSAERVRITLLTSARVKSPPPSVQALHRARVTYHVWDVDRLCRLERSGRVREPITVDFERLIGSALPTLGPRGVPGDYEAYLLLIPGEVLADVYEEHGPRLLELNVRSFLQARGKVNQGIQTTIRTEPHRFLAYNNGISMTASRVEVAELPDGSHGITRIHDLQIVNGGQTTASLHYARTKPRRDESLLKGIHVQAKLSVVPESNLLELVPRISEFANSQNTVRTADFSANDPFHIELQRLSRTVLAPAADGSQRSTRWFYERARGQYADAVASKRTAAERREYKTENPATQVIRKTDLAKYELCWAQRPDLVSLGAEKTFREFMLRLKERPEFKPDTTYFQQLVAKAILFNETEAIVKALRLGGYKSQTVAYTLALVSKRTAQQIDLERIWKAQGIPELLRAAIEELAPKVHAKLISSAGTSNISEWAKKDGAWTAIQTLPWEPDERLLARARQGSKLDLEEQWTPEAKAAALRVYGLNETGWQAVLDWGIATKNLNAGQRKTCRALRDMNIKGSIPTPSLMLEGAAILDLAEEVGFRGI